MSPVVFSSEIRHEEIYLESADKRKRSESPEGSPQSPPPPAKEKLKVFDDEEGSTKSTITSESGSSGSSNEISDFGSSKSRNYFSKFEDEKHEHVIYEQDEDIDNGSEVQDGSEEEYDSEEEYEYRPYAAEPGFKVDWDLWKRYHKQIKDSEGFEIDDFPGNCPAAHYRPLFNLKEKEFSYNILKGLGKLAVDHFNEKNNQEYDFVDIERAVALPSGGILYHLTILAKDPHDGDAVKVLRGKVLNGIKEPVVNFCKLREPANS